MTGSSPQSATRIQRQLDALRRELDERTTALPAHSVKPTQMLRIDELEEQIAALESRLAHLNQESAE